MQVFLMSIVNRSKKRSRYRGHYQPICSPDQRGNNYTALVPFHEE